MSRIKLNPPFALIALAMSALAAHGFFKLNSAAPHQLFVAAGGGVSVLLPLLGLFALASGSRGTAGNIRALSACFLLVEIVVSTLFCMMSRQTPTAYIIINGILLLVYILIACAVMRALK